MPLSLAGATLASGAIGAGATIGSNLLGNLFSSSAAKQNYKYAVKMWNMQNEYNAPINQVRRLEEAGLNPALMYNNAASGGTASSMTPPQVQYNSPLNGVLDKLGSLLQLKQLAANVEKTKQETKNAEISGYGQELQNKLAQQAYDFNTDYNPLRIGSLGADIDLKKVEQASRNLAFDFDKSANPYRLALLRNNLDTAVSALDKLSIEKRNMLLEGALLVAKERNTNADTFSKQASTSYTKVLTRQLEDVGIPMGESQLAVQQMIEGFSELIYGGKSGKNKNSLMYERELTQNRLLNTNSDLKNIEYLLRNDDYEWNNQKTWYGKSGNIRSLIRMIKGK